MTPEDGKQMVGDFVDMMLLADDAVALYHKKRGDEDTPTFQEELDIKERMMFAHALAVMRVQKAAQGGANPQQLFTVDPDGANQGFGRVLTARKISFDQAKAVLEVLTGTPEGKEMLKLLTLTAVLNPAQKEGG